MSNKFLLITLAVPLLGFAEEGSIRGPVAGFVHDRESRAIRQVIGVPGSAYVGAAVVSDADAASIAPDGAFALAVQQSRLLLINGIKTLTPAATALEGAIADADLFSWSRTTAAIYSSATRQAQLVRLGTKPSVDAPIDLSGVPGTVASLALAGDSILAGTEGGGVFLLHRGQAARLIATAQSPTALAVSGADLYFADRDGGSVWQVRDFAGDSSAAIFASGIDSPAGLFLSNGRLFVSGNKQLRIYDLATKSEAASVELEFTPSSFDFVGEPSLLLMSRGITGEQPYYMLDASQNPAVFFVPAGREQ